jgi:hypothetical protein
MADLCHYFCDPVCKLMICNGSGVGSAKASRVAAARRYFIPPMSFHSPSVPALSVNNADLSICFNGKIFA